MGAYTADELIVMALDATVLDEVFSDAFFFHYVPCGSDGHERLLYIIALHRAVVLRESGIDLGQITQAADLIHATHNPELKKTAS